MGPRRIVLLAGDGAAARAIAALVVAAVLAISGAVSVARRPAGAADADVARLDEGLAPARAVLKPGDRVAVPSDVRDRTFRFVTQYALAPAIVIPVRLSDCWRAGDGGSCLAGATHLLLPGVANQQAAALAAPLGFAPVVPTPAGTLLARRAR